MKERRPVRVSGLNSILNKVLTFETHPRGDGFWEEYVGTLTFCFAGQQYYVKDYVKYVCKRVKKKVKKIAIETGDLIILDRRRLVTIKLNPQPMVRK